MIKKKKIVNYYLMLMKKIKKKDYVKNMKKN